MADQRLLLIDTCGATGSVALAEVDRILAVELLPERTASAQLLEAVSRALAAAGWTLDSLTAIGVVRGPGSFTGVRVGLAAAKGLCEALGVPMAAVSRLEVLAERAGATAGFAVMDAGRAELYVRDVATGSESIMAIAALPAPAVGEGDLLGRLPGLQVVEISAADALPAVQRALQAGGSDIALTDASYVRGEADIYARKTPAVA